ncbi:hypothetical protein UFOVP1276_46 [uncultured Caudovirales phage]|uniref:Uncharacterized protein n=1 Tax=uncultured Caudovirales phage TaxID=2100421 RepID=A0A6J5PGI4_9CAUD|nr:hypothetical protein UFOVP875_77 [uncultured Caudovirales phage]CAB4195105.1 hypothetical protein UFOVP1276_46 [uncultured Caudovirales phage]CAB4205084.1 hypothetical protein UFOVP1403_20 [uncultured Caudovirales phage]CAB5238046.1 hypothetical protein UFOVP1507_4 [uncultured Caudovirales phage]
MQRVQLEALKPSMLTDEEFAKYVTLYTPEQLPMSWVAEVVERFIEKLKTVEALENAVAALEDELADTTE